MGVPMPTFPDAVPGIPKGGSLPTTAASSGSATALRRPWRNRKAASDMRKCQRGARHKSAAHPAWVRDSQ